jgi:SAM-dependent methyltransferase
MTGGGGDAMMDRMRMNHRDGKRLLAAVRDGDFAHAGEAAAVRMGWECMPKRPDQSCLDAGCGRGGTAALVQSERWGQVVGLDIDSETISSAQSAYPSVKFVAADVIRAGELFPAQFDIIYAFNAFYAFPDQQAAIAALRLTAKPDAILCLFDYLDRGGFTETPFAGKPETLLWRPLSMKSCRQSSIRPDGVYESGEILARITRSGTASWKTGSLRGAKGSASASSQNSLPMPRTIIAPFSRRLE